MISQISFCTFSDVLPPFNFEIAIGNLSSICLAVHILRPEWSESLATRIDIPRLYVPLLGSN